MTYDTISKTVCALGVMAKAPIAGEVKTRLVPPLTEQEAAELSVCFLRDMAANIASVSETEAASGLVVYTPPGSESDPRPARQDRDDHDVAVRNPRRS